LIGGRRRKLQALPSEGITYPSTATSQFTYDAFGHTVKIVESTGSTKQFIWCNERMCEVRDAAGALVNQYFSYGQTISGGNYFYTKDHLGSIRELTDSSGNIQGQYSYDMYGRVSQYQGSLASDFQYASYYFHAPSALNLAVHRPYSSYVGRWISRDPIQEIGGVNLYGYVANQPDKYLDPSGEVSIIVWIVIIIIVFIGSGCSRKEEKQTIEIPTTVDDKGSGNNGSGGGSTGRTHWYDIDRGYDPTYPEDWRNDPHQGKEWGTPWPGAPPGTYWNPKPWKGPGDIHMPYPPYNDHFWLWNPGNGPIIS
jgi:RHS repeat-associated protein